MKIAFSICNIGFGHVTRSLRIIDELEDRGHEVYVMAGSPQDEFVRNKGYETFTISRSLNLYNGLGKRWSRTLLFLSSATPKVSLSALKSRKVIKRMDPDILVSDSELSSVLSTGDLNKVFITHQPGLFVGERMSKFSILWRKVIKGCEKVIVPDVIDVDIPKDMEGMSEKVGPIAEDIEEDRSTLKERLNIDDGTVLLLPSFSKEQRYSKMKEVEGLDHDFVFLGQDRNMERKNIRFKKRDDVSSSCEYIKASDFVIVSGYTSLMESVYYNKPVFMVPTQLEQEFVAKLGSRAGVLNKGRFERKAIIDFLEDKKLHDRMSEKQKRFGENGTQDAADVIEDAA